MLHIDFKKKDKKNELIKKMIKKSLKYHFLSIKSYAFLLKYGILMKERKI